MQGTGLTLGGLQAASGGAEVGGTAAVEAAVAVLLCFQAQALKVLSRPACSLRDKPR